MCSPHFQRLRHLGHLQHRAPAQPRFPALRIAAEYRGLPAILLHQPQQNSHRRRLARAIRPQKRDQFSRHPSVEDRFPRSAATAAETCLLTHRNSATGIMTSYAILRQSQIACQWSLSEPSHDTCHLGAISASVPDITAFAGMPMHSAAPAFALPAGHIAAAVPRSVGWPSSGRPRVRPIEPPHKSR